MMDFRRKPLNLSDNLIDAAFVFLTFAASVARLESGIICAVLDLVLQCLTKLFWA